MATGTTPPAGTAPPAEQTPLAEQTRPAGTTLARAKRVRSGAVEANVSGHRRGGWSSLAGLGSVRVQLLAPIVVAIAGLVVLGAVQVAAAVSAAGDANRAHVLASTATATVRLGHELERELAETAALRGRGGTSGAQLVTVQQARTDAAVDRYRQASASARKAVSELRETIDAAASSLRDLPGIRDRVKSNEAADQGYRRLVMALLAVSDALPAQIRDNRLATQAREVASVAAIEHFAAVQRDVLLAIFVRGSLAPGDLATLGELAGARTQREAEFQRVAVPADRDRYTETVSGMDVSNAANMWSAALIGDRTPDALGVDADAWYVAQSNTIRRINLVGLTVSDELDRAAADRATNAELRAWATGLGTAAFAGLSLTAATALAVRTSRRLRRLRAAALTVARHELPEAIASAVANPSTAVTAIGNGGTSATAATQRIAAANDEIAQVAEAFASVQQAALRLATEQAELRADVAKMAETLARRIRTLIARQLQLLDEFEREETDPDALARLFALDHLAARLRRNGENLLVLAGGEPSRPIGSAYPLAAVVDAAASEIEDYQRIERGIPAVAVSGPVVGDLAHLLAELLENAASFSAPDSLVRVDARQTVEGVVLRVHDRGIGIAADRIDAINRRLAHRATLSSAAAGTMGLHVVSHLAARHGIAVQLYATGTGTVAYVELPNEILRPIEEVLAGALPAAELPALPALEPGPVPAIPNQRTGDLPKRRPGAQLTPGGQMQPSPFPEQPSSVPDLWDETPDPDAIRARLSALSDGVAAAFRRNRPSTTIEGSP